MKTNINLSVVASVLICCLLITWFSTSIQGVEKTYEVRPQISLPEYKTDAGRAIDAYERLMERQMNMTERHLNRIGTDIQGVAKKLDSIDGKLTTLSCRIAAIEKALGIEQPKCRLKRQIQPVKPENEVKPRRSAPKPEEL